MSDIILQNGEKPWIRFLVPIVCALAATACSQAPEESEIQYVLVESAPDSEITDFKNMLPSQEPMYFSHGQEQFAILPMPDDALLSAGEDGVVRISLGLEPRSLGVSLDETELSEPISQKANAVAEAIESEGQASYFSIPSKKYVSYTLAIGWDLRQPGLSLGRSFILNVDGTAVEFTREGELEQFEEAARWYGVVSGGGAAEFTLFNDGSLVGSFDWQDKDYIVQPLADGQHAIIPLSGDVEEDHPPLELNPEFESSQHPDVDAPGSGSDPANRGQIETSSLLNAVKRVESLDVTTSQNTTATIDILFLYSPRLGLSLDEVETRIVDDALLTMNASFNRGQVRSINLQETLPVRVRRVGIEVATGFTEPTVPEQWKYAYSWLETSEFAQTLRNQKNADITILLTRKLGACGYSPLGQSASHGYAVVRYRCARKPNKYTIAHEIGHILGAAHDAACTTEHKFDHGHGWLNPNDQVATIMASCLNTNCSGCKRQPVWSSPANELNGMPLGDSTANNSMVWRTESRRVSEFRP